MTRALGLLTTLLLVGCTSIPLESAVPTSPAASARATLPPATALGTVLATAPTVTPTPIPTASPTATPSPSPSSTFTPSAAPSVQATNAPSVQPSSTAPQPSATTSAEIAALLTHVPEHLRGTCNEVVTFDQGFLYGIQCINVPGVDGYVTYYQFDTSQNMNTAYEGNRQFFAPDASGTDCAVGPSESGYTVSGVDTGRVVCADYDTGEIMFWTSEPLTILATIVLFSGTYADLNAVWQDAGPLLGEAPPSSPSAETVDWTTSAGTHRDATGQTFTYACPPNGREYTVYGSDVYTDDSSVCTAAVHAGLITFAAGGSVTFKIIEGQDSYSGTERNGVSTNNWGAWDASFVFVTP